ncbi:MAG: SOS response-associated peptidase family protein [Rhizomicrobium sp.]
MCGKFTAMASYAEVVAFEQPLSADRDYKGEADRALTFRVMGNIPLLVWDKETRQRRILFARWGFPARGDWRRPDPVHARAETIEQKPTFRDAFLDGQRGISLIKTFCEAPDVPGPSQQHVITPDAQKSPIAFLWRKFDVGTPDPLYACVMVTVPANTLIAGLPTDRMPAFLEWGDFSKWIGEEHALVDELKTMLKTIEGVHWRMNREERAKTSKRGKPTVSDPGGLF